LNKYLSPNFVKDSKIARSVWEVEIVKGVKLKRDSDKYSTEREKPIESCELTRDPFEGSQDHEQSLYIEKVQ
jgi:hypothetical protein